MASEEYGLGLVRSTSFGRKRVAPPNVRMEFGNHEECLTPRLNLKRQRSQDSFSLVETSIHDMPQEILISILCRVEHDDLKNLILISKPISKAALVAKETHFAFSTPKKTVGFQSANLFDEFVEMEAPNAPKQSRVPRRRLSLKKLFDVSVNLFASGDDDNVDMKN